MDLTWLSPSLAICGQIGIGDIPTLKAQGVRLIINNRPDGEEPGQPESRALATAAQAANIAFAHVPVATTGPTQHDAVEFARAFHNAGGKALAYCRTGNRSAATWRLLGEMQSAKKHG